MKTKGIIFSIASLLFTGSEAIIQMFSMNQASPMTVAFYSSLFGMVFCYCSAKYKKESIRNSCTLKVYGTGIVHTIGIVMLYLSLVLLGPITYGLIGRLYIVFAIILAIWILKERLNLGSYFAIILCLIGSVLVIDFSGEGGGSLLGLLFGVIYSLVFAIAHLMVKQMMDKAGTASIMFHLQATATVLIGAYVLIGEGTDAFFVGNVIFFIALASLLSGFIGMYLFYEGMRYIPFTTANIFRSLKPLVIFIYSFAFFPVAITPSFVGGAGLILGSVIYLSKNQ